MSKPNNIMTNSWRKYMVRTLLVLVCTLQFSSSMAQESKFKALFLYKFSEYVQWPERAGVLKVGVLGKTDVKSQLERFGASKGGIEVITVSSPSDVSNCQMLYIPKSEDKKLSEYAAAIEKNAVLLVCDNSSKVGKGADIGFYLESEKLRFKIDKNNIESKKMLPSSKLLALGKSIN